MKLKYSAQTLLTVGIVIVFNILTTVLKHWIFHSIGFILCGLIWIVNPVMFQDRTPTRMQTFIIRLSGVVLICMGIFSRAYLY